MLVLHHNDADGRLGAAIIGRSPLGTQPVKYIELSFAKIKEPAFIAEIKAEAAKHKETFMVDFSLPVDQMQELDKLTTFTWIDHHATCKDYPNFKGLRDFTNKGPAGCELAWKHCWPKVPAPYAVALVGDYDAWRLEKSPQSRHLILYLDSRQDAPGAMEWNTLLHDDRYTTQCVLKGAVMEQYKTGFCKGLRASYGYETTFHDLKCAVLNIQQTGSDAFGPHFDKYDACIAMINDGKLWTVSMYSKKPNVDCGAICKQHSGGGHRGAAGFQCKELPFTRTGALSEA